MKRLNQIADLIIVNPGWYFYNNVERMKVPIWTRIINNTECMFWYINEGLCLERIVWSIYVFE